MRTKIATLPSLLMVGALLLTIVVGSMSSRGATNYPGLPISGAEYIFAAPYGWNRIEATTLGLGTWLHPGDTGYTQKITARADHFNGTLDELAQKMVTSIKSQHKDAKLGRIQSTTVCSGHPAIYLAFQATDKGVPVMYEQMLTLYSNTAYAATYSRATAEQAIHAARTSLTTLCGGHPPKGYSTPVPAVLRTPTPTPSPLVNINTPQPMYTYGNPAATITPRLGP